MGWLSRIFPGSKPKADKASSAPSAKPAATAARPSASASTTSTADSKSAIPPEKVGLDGEFDESGLAKRVALAFDETPGLDDIETLWVAQLSSKVVLKGKVPSQAILNQVVAVASKVKGATEVDTSQVTIG
jgi:osmotically-inducible protein OsmY